MTLIVGLKTDNCVVIGSEREESGGIAAKRSVTKLKLITGRDWSVVVGGAGDASIAENAMRRMEKQLLEHQSLDEAMLTEITEQVLDTVYTKYIDKDPKSDGLGLIIGASCRNELYLISTERRVSQVQDSIACAGFGADIGIYFLDRLHEPGEDWVYSGTVVGFILQQAIEACRYCGGESEIYVLQCPPSPRWRSLGKCDAPCEFHNSFSASNVSSHLKLLIEKRLLNAEGIAGYSDERHPNDVTIEDRMEELLRRQSASETSE